MGVEEFQYLLGAGPFCRFEGNGTGFTKPIDVVFQPVHLS